MTSAPVDSFQGGPICRSWAQQEHLAAELKRLAENITQPHMMSEFDYRIIAGYLRQLARTPAALDALLGTQKPGHPTGLHRDYRIAVDYLATLERLRKAAAAIADVMKAWGIKSRSTVTDANRLCKDAARRELQRLEHANPNMERNQLLQAISRNLRSPRKSAE